MDTPLYYFQNKKADKCDNLTSYWLCVFSVWLFNNWPANDSNRKYQRYYRYFTKILLRKIELPS